MEILYMLRSKHILGVGVLFCFFFFLLHVWIKSYSYLQTLAK